MSKNRYEIAPSDDVLTYKGQKFAVKKMGTKAYGENRFASAVKEGAEANASGAYQVTILQVRLHHDGTREIITTCGSKGFDVGSRKLAGYFVWYPDRGVKFEEVEKE